MVQYGTMQYYTYKVICSDKQDVNVLVLLSIHCSQLG
uniref:Uncharacterized protein n=1 Tax=Anguilla anguilla TaxID=7936 RepID=A0A0E9SI86_ANGAN